MKTLLLILTALWTLLVVFLRRVVKGPLHPGWSYRFEAINEVLRNNVAAGIGLPVEELRRGMLSARIHPTVWKALRHERSSFAGRPAETFTPRNWTPSDPTILYFHGGGYMVCSPATHRDLVSRIAVAAGARAIAIDYRKAPEHPFPMPIEDCEAAYQALLTEGTRPERIFFGGDSAGGGLTLAVLLRAKEAGLPMPRGAVLLSPWVDLECLGDSIKENAPFDYLPPAGLPLGADIYLQGADRRHPHASPVHADLRGLPPLLVLTGGAELFRSENERFVDCARAANVEVTHKVEAGMVHVYPAFATFVPECAPAIDEIGAFVRRHQPSPDGTADQLEGNVSPASVPA